MCQDVSEWSEQTAMQSCIRFAMEQMDDHEQTSILSASEEFGTQVAACLILNSATMAFKTAMVTTSESKSDWWDAENKLHLKIAGEKIIGFYGAAAMEVENLRLGVLSWFNALRKGSDGVSCEARSMLQTLKKSFSELAPLLKSQSFAKVAVRINEKWTGFQELLVSLFCGLPVIQVEGKLRLDHMSILREEVSQAIASSIWLGGQLKNSTPLTLRMNLMFVLYSRIRRDAGEELGGRGGAVSLKNFMRQIPNLTIQAFESFKVQLDLDSAFKEVVEKQKQDFQAKSKAGQDQQKAKSSSGRLKSLSPYKQAWTSRKTLKFIGVSAFVYLSTLCAQLSPVWLAIQQLSLFLLRSVVAKKPDDDGAQSQQSREIKALADQLRNLQAQAKAVPSHWGLKLTEVDCVEKCEETAVLRGFCDISRPHFSAFHFDPGFQPQMVPFQQYAAPQAVGAIGDVKPKAGGPPPLFNTFRLIVEVCKEKRLDRAQTDKVLTMYSCMNGDKCRLKAQGRCSLLHDNSGISLKGLQPDEARSRVGKHVQSLQTQKKL